MYSSIYKKKIIDVNQLIKKIGKFPRNQKIIICHGNFDVVHPGHVRHLIYAKSKADLLVVSVTADKYINKGFNRPFVPENLRALNLSAFEMVDYVLIDRNATPLKNLMKIKPDFYAKGFEYSSNGLPQATKEELKVIRSYGGEMIFTPGDIVYSSTKLLSLSKPKIEKEKLISFMNQFKINHNLIINTLKSFKSLTVHIIGDTIVDTYTRTSLIGGNVKTPTTSVLYQSKEDYVGGAGIVAKHLKAAGAKVIFTSVVGNDKLGLFVKKEMKQNKIISNLFIDSTRPTTNKNIILNGLYKLLKIDKVDNHPISPNVFKYINDLIKKIKCDIIIFSDFRHGIFNYDNINKFTKSIRKKVFKVADSQVATRWGNVLDFKNFDLVTPNEREVRFSLADQDSSLSYLSRELARKINYNYLILKLGERGVVSVDRSASKKKTQKAFTLSSFADNIIDTNGTGDALLAYSSLALAKTKSLSLSSIIGSIAAACECEKDGNEEVKIEEIIAKYELILQSTNYGFNK